MARRATVIEEAHSAAENVLVLDAGNGLFGEPGSSREPARRTQGRSSVELLDRLDYDAVALGEADLGIPKEELQQRLTEAKGVTFLSANLRDEATKRLLAEPYVVREIAGQRVALIGITGAENDPPAGYRVDPPLEAARHYVREVEARAEVVILLSNAGVNINRAIAAEVPGIDLIISGGRGLLAEPEEVAEGVLVVQAETSSPGNAGRTVGMLEAEFDSTGRLVEHSWRRVTLDGSVADDADLAAWVQSMTPAQ